ncbi:MAG: hypothetical protein JNM84_22335 [Planctomycetes bacterium]|nr:hypothetical protein [Planctomycetota bacterium]
MSALRFLRTLAALVAGALAPAAHAVPVQDAPRGAECRVLACEPALGDAAASAFRAFEAAVFLRSPLALAELVLEMPTDRPGLDPLRSALAAESFLARVAERGGRARLADGDPAENVAGCVRLRVAVERRSNELALSLRGAGVEDPLAGAELRVPFVEKPWVRGALDVPARFAQVLRVAGRGLSPEAARDAALEAARAALRERVEAAAPIDAAHLAAKLPEWELDRFESQDPESGLSNCVLLLGLRDEDLRELRAERLRARRLALGGFALRGGAGCLWFALCVMLYAKADLATRGYLSWPLRAGFALLLAAGTAVLLLWL